jgi:tetratricopeptide (TPR) repeat protein
MLRWLRYGYTKALRYGWAAGLWLFLMGYLVGRGWLHPLVVVLQVPFVLLLLSSGRLWSVVRTAWCLRGFETFDGHTVEVQYAPELKGKLDLAHQVPQWERVLKELEAQFGFKLACRPTVYLFASSREVSDLLQSEAGGFAMSDGCAVFLGVDCLEAPGTSLEAVRHEFGHLFAAQWSRHGPEVKTEGLATWLQGSEGGLPLDLHALAYVLGAKYWPITWLIDPSHFDQDRYYSYVVSGSFTGFLIRSYGWDTYEEFYRRAHPQNFADAFEAVFNADLLTVERRWRDDLLSRRAEFEPRVSEWLRRRRAMAAYDTWAIIQCLEDLQALEQQGPMNTADHSTAAWCHTILGDYADGIRHLQRALELDEPGTKAYHIHGWFHLAVLHDLLGQRLQAMDAYERCLQEPEDPADPVHSKSRNRLVKPYNEADLVRQILS